MLLIKSGDICCDVVNHVDNFLANLPQSYFRSFTVLSKTVNVLAHYLFVNIFYCSLKKLFNDFLLLKAVIT